MSAPGANSNSCLLGIQLDDQLLVELYLNQIFAFGMGQDAAAKRIAVHFQPVGRRRVCGGVAGGQNGGVLLALFASLDHIVDAYLERRDVDLAAIHGEVAMADKLAGLGAAGAESHAIEKVFEPAFGGVQEGLAAAARAGGG